MNLFHQLQKVDSFQLDVAFSLVETFHHSMMNVLSPMSTICRVAAITAKKDVTLGLFT